MSRTLATTALHACEATLPKVGRAGVFVFGGASERQDDYCEPGSRGAPEAKGLCEYGRCAPVSPKGHVFDWANRAFILPAIIRLSSLPKATALLKDLRARMSDRDPDRRPDFADLVETRVTG